MDLAAIEQTIRDAITRARDAGWTVEAGAIGYDDTCCPLGALNLKRADEYEAVAQELLGVSRDWVWSFISGFDSTTIAKLAVGDDELSDVVLVPEARALGEKLRVEVLSGAL